MYQITKNTKTYVFRTWLCSLEKGNEYEIQNHRILFFLCHTLSNMYHSSFKSETAKYLVNSSSKA